MSSIELIRTELPVDLVENNLKEIVGYGDYGLLSHEVLNQWSARSVWTAAPSGTDVQRLINLQAGGIEYSDRTNPTVTAFISQYLREGATRLALFEDAVASADDLLVAGSTSPYAVIDEKVFPFLTGGDHAKTEVDDLILESYSWRLVGILTTWTARPVGHELGSSLRDLVAASRHVVVGAWDGEGLVVIDR